MLKKNSSSKLIISKLSSTSSSSASSSSTGSSSASSSSTGSFPNAASSSASSSSTGFLDASASSSSSASSLSIGFFSDDPLTKFSKDCHDNPSSALKFLDENPDFDVNTILPDKSTSLLQCVSGDNTTGKKDPKRKELAIRLLANGADIHLTAQEYGTDNEISPDDVISRHESAMSEYKIEGPFSSKKTPEKPGKLYTNTRGLIIAKRNELNPPCCCTVL